MAGGSKTSGSTAEQVCTREYRDRHTSIRCRSVSGSRYRPRNSRPERANDRLADRPAGVVDRGAPRPCGPRAGAAKGHSSFWQNSSLTTPFNVTGGPALAQCKGFTPAGLPLSLQLVGRPFDEATVLRAAHAYEMATNWRGRRPHLDPAATF